MRFSKFHVLLVDCKAQTGEKQVLDEIRVGVNHAPFILGGHFALQLTGQRTWKKKQLLFAQFRPLDPRNVQLVEATDLAYGAGSFKRAVSDQTNIAKEYKYH